MLNILENIELKAKDAMYINVQEGDATMIIHDLMFGQIFLKLQVPHR